MYSYIYIYNFKRYQTVYKYSTYFVSLCLYNLVVYAVNKFRRKHAPLINQFFFVTLQESELTHFVPRQILRVVYLLLPNNIFIPPPRKHELHKMRYNKILRLGLFNHLKKYYRNELSIKYIPDFAISYPQMRIFSLIGLYTEDY